MGPTYVAIVRSRYCMLICIPLTLAKTFVMIIPMFFCAHGFNLNPLLQNVLPGSASSLGQPGSSSSKGQEVESEEEDVLEYLNVKEATEFNPTVIDADTWEVGEVIDTFLVKHFNRSVITDEREAIMKDFPKPSCQAVQAPKLDNDMKRQIKKAGKNPHYGAERSLYRLQDQLLDKARPLLVYGQDPLPVYEFS